MSITIRKFISMNTTWLYFKQKKLYLKKITIKNEHGFFDIDIHEVIWH